MKGVTALKQFALLRVAALLVIVTTGLASYLALSPLPAKAATSDTVLFIHGFAGGQSNGSTNTVPGGCEGATTWGTAKTYFRNHGWTGNLLTVGYYRGDWQNGNSCSIQFDRQAPNSNHQSNCDSYHFDATVEGSNNQDLGNIACQLAWYIYNTYTTSGQNVHVVAHSMGGMIIHYALDRVYAQDSAFPPYLDVPTVVTIASPHGGIPNPGGAHFACGGCVMASNMQQGTNGPDYFINTLLNESVAPMGSPGEPTQWTLMASDCESWTEGVADDAALKFPNGRSGYPVVHKIDYDIVPNTGGCPNDYLHGDYLTDQSDSHDASAYTCDNCTSYPPSNYESGTVYHSLHVTYQNTAISIPAAPAYAVLNQSWGANFLNDWWQTGGVNGELGDPTNGLYSLLVGGQVGWAQNFWTGGTYWWPATGDHVVHGAIYTLYNNGFNGAAGGLGFPTTDEMGIANGRVSYFYGNLCGGRGPNNSGAAIYYSGTTGAHQVGGCIYNHYWSALGGPSGNSSYKLGFPTSDVLAISGGYVSYFAGQSCNGGGPDSSGSAIYYSSSTSAHEVQGCIYAEYVDFVNGPSGPLGYPVTDEQGIANGRVSYFAGQSCNGGGPNGSGSAIYYSGSVAPYANEVQGCIYHEYVGVMGGPGGALGFPIWDETGVASGRVSYFAGQLCGAGGPAYGGVTSGSGIFWTSGTGAHEVQGCIYNKYWHMPLGLNGQNQDGPGGPLGFPTADERGVNSGYSSRPARFSSFQHGSIYYYNGNAYEVQGAIYNAYLNNGGAGGVMGLPCSDEYTNAGGNRESDFEDGFIVYYPATGQIYVAIYPTGC